MVDYGLQVVRRSDISCRARLCASGVRRSISVCVVLWVVLLLRWWCYRRLGVSVMVAWENVLSNLLRWVGLWVKLVMWLLGTVLT